MPLRATVVTLAASAVLTGAAGQVPAEDASAFRAVISTPDGVDQGEWTVGMAGHGSGRIDRGTARK